MILFWESLLAPMQAVIETERIIKLTLADTGMETVSYRVLGFISADMLDLI